MNKVTITNDFELEDEMFEDYYSLVLEDENILHTAIAQHEHKRTNRKYINARKFLIKDKGHLFNKGWHTISSYKSNLN